MGLNKVNKELQKEMDRAVRMNYSAAGIALKREWGWGAMRLKKMFLESQELFEACASTNEKCMVQMLEEDTGIEICNEKGEHWRDYPYTNAEIWDGRRPSNPELIYIRQRQKNWVSPQIVACILLAMHRLYGFSTIRDQRLLGQMDEIKEECHYSDRELMDLLEKETTIDLRKGFKMAVEKGE